MVNDFAVGDVVMLNSGGPEMTIYRIEDDRVLVIWYSEDELKFREECFDPLTLRQIEA